MRSKFKIPLLLCFSMTLAGCGALKNIKELNIPKINPSLIKQSKIEKKTIAISCGKGDINKFTDEGWKIKNTTKQEVICTWKTQKAKKGCDIKNDKGCKVTIPDKMGEQVIYSLEREVSIKK